LLHIIVEIRGEFFGITLELVEIYRSLVDSPKKKNKHEGNKNGQQRPDVHAPLPTVQVKVIFTVSPDL
jgi:hypothetical protein